MLKWWIFITIAFIWISFLTACSEKVTSPAALMTNRPDPPTEYLEKRNPKGGNIETEKAGRDVWFHSDGNITDILPDLLELGVDVLFS